MDEQGHAQLVWGEYISFLPNWADNVGRISTHYQLEKKFLLEDGLIKSH